MDRRLTQTKFNKRLSALRSERSSFMDYWKELSDQHLAHRGRFLSSDRNKGHKRNTKQINNTSRKASRTQASGMMAGITSPARPWFRLATPNAALMEIAAVKEWLFEVEGLMNEAFNRSNLYNTLPILYAELGTFATACMGVFRDDTKGIRCRHYTVGSYMLGMNGKNEIDTFYREYELSVGQLVKEFGLDNVSPRIKDLWDRGQTEAWVKVVHAVEPNDDRDHLSPLAEHMRYRSVYYEADHKGKGREDQFLRVSGFETFPIMAPRWEVTGEDIYGTDCPGMMTLGDAKALQLAERRSFQGLGKITNPPMLAPSGLQSQIQQGGLIEGEVIFTTDPTQKLESAYNQRPEIEKIEAKIERIEQRIEEGYFADLFLMLANSDRRQITAREVVERHEEKLLMLGPVLERLHGELLDPLIDRTFHILLTEGVFPEPPEALQEAGDLKVEYISVLAQAQRMVAVGGIERVAGFVGELSQLYPDARHKFDAEQAIDEYAESVGISPRIIRGDDEVAQLKEAEAKRAQQAEMMAMAEQASNIASNMPAPSGGPGAPGDAPTTDVMRLAGLV